VYDYYRDKRIFDLVDGNRSFSNVRASIFKILDRFFTPVQA
jgi:hypothetical protein